MKTERKNPTAFRFDPVVKDALDFIADREGRSKANMLEWLIRKHCEREGLGWPPVTPEVHVVSADDLLANVRAHMARGEKPTWAGKTVAVVGGKKPVAAKAVSETKAKPSVKTAKNTKQGK
jgi:hypothetical protein